MTRKHPTVLAWIAEHQTKAAEMAAIAFERREAGRLRSAQFHFRLAEIEARAARRLSGLED
jgi:hypothetical protein